MPDSDNEAMAKPEQEQEHKAGALEQEQEQEQEPKAGALEQEQEQEQEPKAGALEQEQEQEQEPKEDLPLQFWQLYWSEEEDNSSLSSSSECSLSLSECSSESSSGLLSPISSLISCSSNSSCFSLLELGVSEGDESAGVPTVPGEAQSASTSVPSLCVGGDHAEMPPQGESPPTPAEGPDSLQGAAAAEPSGTEVLSKQVTEMVGFLLLKFVTMELTTKAELLRVICPHDHDLFAVIFPRACESLQLVFGVRVQEIDCHDQAYVLIKIEGFKPDEEVCREVGMPQSALLLLILGFVMQEGGCASKEAIWGTLNTLRLQTRGTHAVLGDPKELLIKLWVQQQYLECRQMLGTHSLFLWGPRAHAESNKSKLLEFWLAVGCKGHKSCPCPADTEQERP